MIETLLSIYDQFLAIFPTELHTIISLILFILIVVSTWRLVKNNIIWLVLLIIFIPASIPILRSLFKGLLVFLTNLLP